MPTNPLLAGRTQLVLAALVLVAGLGVGIRWPWVLVVAGSLGIVALSQAIRATVELERRRRTADELLLRGAVARPSSILLSWRAGELTSPRVRSTVAHSLERIEREARGATRPGPVPLNTGAIRCHLGLVSALRKRVDDHSRPVSARGMLFVDQLLTVPRSPLYSRVPEEALAEALGEALAALETTSAAVAT